MLALLGEKKIRFFPHGGVAPIFLDYSDFFKNYYKNTSQIILDKTCVDFYIDYLKNTSLQDAIQSLICKRKTLNINERSFLVEKESFFASLFCDDFYMQTYAVNDSDFFSSVTKFGNDLFLIEYAVRDLCKSIIDINYDTWWLYIGEHKSSGIKIVAGIGNGISYSRSFDNKSDIERKIVETIRFLVREGLNSNLKIISCIDYDIYIENFEIINIPKRDVELELVKFFTTKNITPQFSKDSYIRRFLKERYSRIVYLLIIFLFFGICVLYYINNEILEQKNIIEIDKEKTDVYVKDKSNTFSAKINGKNAGFISHFISMNALTKNPITNIKKTSNFLKQYGIKTNLINIGRNYIKIKCSLNSKQLDELEKISKQSVSETLNDSITIKKINNEILEYEELENSLNKNYDVEICIKMN